MKPVKEAKKYAKTFINITGIEEAPAALAELGMIGKLMEESSDFRNLLLNPGFTDAERAQAIAGIAAKAGLSEKVVKFVTHITTARVIAALPEIIKIAVAIYQEKKNRAKAVVMTPVEISGDKQERLRSSLKNMVGKDIDMEFVLDPSLLGGVLVKVGSTMYDSSIKGQLRLLKDELIKG